MKRVLSLFLVCTASFAFADEPSASDVSIAQDADTRLVTVSYVLTNGPAIVTAEILQDGVPLKESEYWYLKGDVNCKVTKDGPHAFTWDPFSGTSVVRPTDGLSARVTVWSLDDPPQYLAVNIATNATWLTAYYATSNNVPGGVLANPLYRQTVMLFRHVPAKGVTWQMGCPAFEEFNSGYYSREIPHNVTLPEDYWIGIFPVTYSQYFKFTSESGQWSGNSPYTPISLSFNAIRDGNIGRGNTTAVTYYPAEPYSGSYIGLLRARTHVAFELPTDAQWEYACRAGTTTGYWNTGKPITSGSEDPNLPGIYSKNRDQRSRAVGSWDPNAWGIYDMHGNGDEWCLDWYQADISAFTAGELNISSTDGRYLRDGVTLGEYHVLRGGSIQSEAVGCRSAQRNGWYPSTSTYTDYIIFRLAIPIRAELD